MSNRCVISAFAFIALSVFAVGADRGGASVKDDHKALQNPQGLWTRSNGNEKTQLHFEGKEFPKLEVTITESVRGGKGFVTIESFKIDATLLERDGKHLLVIDGKDISYRFADNQDFLILKGEFEYKKKKINLSGEWGKTIQASKK